MLTRHTLILTGLILFVVALGVGGALWWKSHPASSNGAVQSTRSSAEIHREWIEKTQKVLDQYAQDHEAEQARDALTQVTVTAEDRDTHLALVLALEALHQKTPDADNRFEKAVQSFHRQAL